MQEQVDCIVPAAGLSTRMGPSGLPKPLVELRGKPLLVNALGNALQVCRRCIVVTGHRHGEIEEYLLASRSRGDTGDVDFSRVEAVFNPDYQRGMFSSIRAGAQHVSSDWFFVAPADMPFLDPSVFRALLDAAEAALPEGGPPGEAMKGGAALKGDAAPVAFFPEYRGRRGHPVLISREVIPAMSGPSRSGGNWGSMRDFLADRETRVLPVESEGILLDVDTPGSLERARRR
ncbi:MAG: nucleotidyltransferase family protein [Spirochaetaceae bacterium]|nr:MAG: nucleotidyltransferase family protein [Spirochaetaceae bacterium]